MDWNHLAALWGPATPFIALLVWGHWYLLYRFLPSQAKRIEHRVDAEIERQDERHVQTLTALEEIHKVLKRIAGDVHIDKETSTSTNGKHAKPVVKKRPTKPQ